jgi:hypothetical protein
MRVEVVPPGPQEADDKQIRAVVRVVAEVPAGMQAMFTGRAAEVAAVFNAFAALSAIFVDGARVCVVSRLTIHRGDDAWQKLHLPMLLFTTINGVEALLGGVGRSLQQERPRGGASEWGHRDF